jgi:hypothetical protein
MNMIFELIFTVHKGNKTLGVTQFFFPNSFSKRRTGPKGANGLDIILLYLKSNPHNSYGYSNNSG